MTETGFANTAIDAAHAFRAIMHAMARPGSVVALDAPLRPPAPLNSVSAAVALTLCDFQTPVWLSPALADAHAVHYLKFHTGAPVAGHAGDAQFVFLSAEDEMPSLPLLAQGTHEYPDRSATLVIQVQSFHQRGARLSGPGINGAVDFGVEGITPSFWAAMADNHARFPVGADVIFAAPHSIAAVPRSSAIQIQENV